MSIETREIKLGGEVCNYTLERKRVKNINLRIKPGQVIYVSADKRVSIGVIEAFIRSKEAFLKKMKKIGKIKRLAGKQVIIQGMK